MTDKDLLELAAKAAAYCVLSEWSKEEGSFDGFVIASDFHPFRAYWNPLTNDGDALRLAVILTIDVGFGTDGKGAFVCALVDGEPTYASHNGGNPLAATRRAIVCAAAAIGLNVPTSTIVQRSNSPTNS